MNLAKIGFSLAFLLSASSASAQVDCRSASGVLALMATPAIENATDVDDTPGATALSVRGTTRILANPGTAPVPERCSAAISMRVFFSTEEAPLRTLPGLAANAQWSALDAVPNVDAALTGTGNVRNARGTIPSARLRPGTVVFYRWAKVIDHPTAADPYTWSGIMQLRVPNRQAPPQVANLEAVSIDRPIFCTAGGTDGDGTFTYERVAENFCRALPNTGFTRAGTAHGQDLLRLTGFLLPDIRFTIRNTGTAATSGGFEAQLFLGRASGTPLFARGFGPLAQNGTVALVRTNRGRADLYRFASDGNDPRYCYIRVELDGSRPAALEQNGYTVKLDTGAAPVTQSPGETERFACGHPVTN